MTHEDALEFLRENQDEKYRSFNLALIPNVPDMDSIGVRIPVIRRLAKDFYRNSTARERETFWSQLPHRYLEENQLHFFMLEFIKDFDECIARVEEFLPYVDNWAVCDGKNPECFKKNPEGLLERIKIWIKSDRPYTVRFAIGMLMADFLDDLFKSEYLEMVAAVKSDHYYVNMMVCWYFATALAKQWDAAEVYFRERRLGDWCHAKSIQKACESFRVTDQHKALLRSWKKHSLRQ